MQTLRGDATVGPADVGPNVNDGYPSGPAVTSSLEYFVTKSLDDLIKHDAQRMIFVTECVRRFESGDYGVVEQDELTDNATAIADGVGTVTGVYKATFPTGDCGNQVCVSRDYEGNDEINPIVVYLPLER